MNVVEPAPWSRARWSLAWRYHPVVGVLGRRRRMVFYEQLHRLARTGTPMPTAFAELARHASSGERGTYGKVAARLRDGVALGDALAAAPELVDPTTLELIRAAEQAGTLPATLESRVKELREVGRMTMSALVVAIYPAFLAVMFVLVSPLFEVAPTITGGSSLGDMAGVYTSALARNVFWLLSFGSALFFLPAFIRWAGWERGWDELRLGLPGVGGVSRRLYIARLCSVLSTALGAGLEVGRSVRLAVTATDSPALARKAATAERMARSGASLSEVLGSLGLLDGEALAQVAIGERTGDLPALLGRTALDSWERMLRLAKTLVFVAIGASVVVLLGMAATTILKGYMGYWKTLDDLSKP